MTTDRERLASAIVEWAGLAGGVLDRCNRSDLAQVSRSLARRVDADITRVLVAGDFKQGKGNLINAIVGEDACSTEVIVPTAVPTVCRYTPEPAAWVLERRAGVIRRRSVTHLEALAAQEGTWPDVLIVELGVPSATLARGLELVDCPPASTRQSARAATLEAARSADVALLVSDATQALTAPEVGFLSELSSVLPTTLVVTKCDLVVHWRDVVAENRETLAQQRLNCELVTVAARIHSWTTPDGDDEGASGIEALVDGVLERADATRRNALIAEATPLLTSMLEEARSDQQRDLAAFGDRGLLRERIRQAEVDLDRCQSLRNPSSGWRRLLDARCDEISSDLRDQTAERLREVVAVATETLDRVDPGKDWETFEPWLRDLAGRVATDVITEVERRVAELAREVGQAFADSEALAVDGFAQSAPEAEELHVTLGSLPEGRLARFVREGFATLGSTSAGLLAFATLGGVISAAVLAPLTVIVGAGLGGTAVIAERRTERAVRQQRAAEAVERYADVVRHDIDETVVAGLADFRTRTCDQLIGRADQLVTTARRQLDVAEHAVEDAEAARDRLAQVSQNVTEIDDLLERMRRQLDRLAGGDQ